VFVPNRIRFVPGVLMKILKATMLLVKEGIKMSKFLADRLVAFFMRRGVLEGENEQIIKYGYEIIFYSLMQIAFLLALGRILRKSVEAIIFVISFSMVRRHVGGYHANSKIQCTLLTSVLLLVVVFLPEQFKQEQSLVLILMTLFYMLVFQLLAPVESERKLLSIKQKERNRKYGFAVATGFTIIAYMLLKYRKRGGREIVITFFLVALLMIIEIIKKESGMRKDTKVENTMVQIGKKIAQIARNDASLLMCYQIEESEEIRRAIDGTIEKLEDKR